MSGIPLRPMLPQTSALAELCWVARGRAIAAKTNREAAADWMVARGAPERAIRIVKSPVGSGSTGSSTLGTPFEGIAIGPWSDAMRTASAFYRILSDNGFTRIPLQRRVGMIASAPTAGLLAEGSAIPLSQVILNNVVLSPIKAAGLIALSEELLLAVDGPGQASFSRSLQAVLAAAVDLAFVNVIGTGTTPITSTGPNKDLRALLTAVNMVGIARPYFIASVDVGKFASSLPTFLPAFSAASATGGELANLPLLVSSGVPAGTLYLVDGVGIAADGASPEVTASSETDVQMDSAPTGSSATPTASTMVSMYATNSVAVKALAIFGAAKLRADAVAVVNGITSTTWAA